MFNIYVGSNTRRASLACRRAMKDKVLQRLGTCNLDVSATTEPTFLLMLLVGFQGCVEAGACVHALCRYGVKGEALRGGEQEGEDEQEEEGGGGGGGEA